MIKNIIIILSYLLIGYIIEKLILKYTSWHDLFDYGDGILICMIIVWPLILLFTLIGVLFGKIQRLLF